MKKRVFIPLIILVVFLYSNLAAQEAKKLNPGERYTNTSGQVEYILTSEKTKDLLKKEESLGISKKRVTLLKEQVAVLQLRAAVADSAIAIKRVEAQFWYDKLLATDKELEKERIARTRFWNSRTFWFTVGALTASVVIVSDN